MVNTISPNYYAAQSLGRDYLLNGIGFAQIPGDAVGVIAVSNDQPLAFRDGTAGHLVFDIVSKTATEMLLRQSIEYAHVSDSYLGAILSADRQTIYWVNDTKPLP